MPLVDDRLNDGKSGALQADDKIWTPVDRSIGRRSLVAWLSATDPLEMVHPALDTADFAKFDAAGLGSMLPAMYRDCYDGTDPWKEGEEASEHYPLGDDLLYGDCEIKEVGSSTPNYLDFPSIQELFVDFGVSAYVRNSVWSGSTAKLAHESTTGLNVTSWDYNANVSLLEWIKIPNPNVPAVTNIDNFVDSASDALRAIEYTHNYEVLANLYCTYALGHEVHCPTE